MHVLDMESTGAEWVAVPPKRTTSKYKNYQLIKYIIFKTTFFLTGNNGLQSEANVLFFLYDK